MKKTNNLWRIIWIAGIFIILLIILYLVIIYKVKWEHKDLNTYLYFYNCGHNLCTSDVKQENYYNKVVCEDEICPYIVNNNNNNIILKREEKSWIYNYIDNKIIHSDYVNYKYLRDDLYVYTDVSGKQGILSLTDGQLIGPKYDNIVDYKDGFVAYISNNLYGIDSLDDELDVSPEYENVVLINDKMFAVKKENFYYINSYGNINDTDNNHKYNYVYSVNDVIFVMNNKKIDILNSDLKSTLLMKIDSFYEYKVEKERESLNFYYDGEIVHFDVFTGEREFTSYKYNLSNKKLI